MSKDALKKFRPSSGMPNLKQKFKRMGYMADGGGVTAGQQMDVSDAVNTMSMHRLKIVGERTQPCLMSRDGLKGADVVLSGNLIMISSCHNWWMSSRATGPNP